MTSAVADFLSEVPILHDIPDVLRAELAVRASVETLHAGEWLFRQGDDGDRIHLVRSGRLEVVREEPPPAAVIATMSRGAAVGELALLTHGRRAASVRALRDSELVTIAREDFESLLETNGKFAVALTAALALQVQRGGTPERREMDRVIALTPLGAGVPVEALATWLVDEIGRHRSVACLREPPGVAPAEYGALLDRQERAHDHVILLTGRDDQAEPSPWIRFCLRQADRVVALVDADQPPPDTPGVGTMRGADVAVLSRMPAAGEHVDAWIARHGCRRRHWLPKGSGMEPAMRRLARRLTRQSVGLVLSGGGARGFAHLGVLAALGQAGIVVDRFGGTSLGSLVAALFAQGLGPREAAEVCRQELVASRPFADYTLPRKALLRGARGQAMLARVFGDTRAEELPHSWFAVSADLLAGAPVVHRSGLVRQAVAASIALPGLAPPQLHGDRLLIDGGVLDNLPIDVMADADEGPVIAVDVMARWGRRWRERHAVEGWRAHLRSSMGWGPPLPSLVETIAGASVIGSRQMTQRHRDRAALVISPELDDIELLHWGRIGEIVREGRRAAEAVLADEQVRAPLALR